MRLSVAPRSLKLISRITPREMNKSDKNWQDTRLDARSVSVDKSQINSSLTSRVAAMFLSRRNRTPLHQLSHDLSAREVNSKNNNVENSSSTNEKNTNENSTAHAGPHKNPNEKATIENQKENGAKSAKENEAKSTKENEAKSAKENDAKSAKENEAKSAKENEAKSAKENEANSAKENGAKSTKENEKSSGSSVSEAPKSSSNTKGLVSESQKSSNNSASTDPKVQKNPSDTGKSASDGKTNGTKTAPEAQKEKDTDKNKDKNQNQNQKADASKEKSKENVDRNKSTQGESSTPAVDSTNGKDTSNEDVKNAASPISAPKNESLPPTSPQEPATADNQSTGLKGANTEKNNSLKVDESAQSQATSPLENKVSTEKTDPDKINNSAPSSGTNLPSENSSLEVTQLPDKVSPNENVKDVPPGSLTASAKASLDSEIPKISAKQSTNDNSHSDVVKWIFSIFGILLFLTIIIYFIRLLLRHRRLGKAESPPPSPLINRMEPMPRGFSNNTTFDRDFNNNSNNFYPFHEEERLRTMEMNKTYGRVI
ncbi:hypothetical protein EPUL_001764 [Erysiphe pulchra]|uniref:Uncharacterized protein n=1 Tax=Erysiphe pulchra TaxID=225359 RepID=A0A2S4PXS8_9PEZI|nr:hypothetical protein EPUL_001764 [Erysiphe pulchra]